MSDRRTWACRRAVGTVAAGLLVGACSAGSEVSPVASPTATAAAVGTPVPVSLPMTTALTPTTMADADEVAATDEVAITAVTASPITIETPAPTSMWVVFEEVEEPFPPVVFGGVRIPQSEDDVAGALWWHSSSFGRPSRPPTRFEHAGAVFDQCRIEDAYFGRYGWYPDEGGIPDQYRRDWFRHSSPDDCRGTELTSSQPLFGLWPGRYFTFDDSGRQSDSFASAQEALKWYANEVAEYGEDSIPAGMTPAGMIGKDDGSGPSLPQIRYSDAVDPVDEVRVLPGTVAFGADGALRGLVRNWSRDLWAYGTVVKAGGREWVWPLSIQPGEMAPFEIENWGGPAAAVSVDFSVTAEMSADADLSRAWYARWSQDYYDYLTRSSDDVAEPEAFPYVFERVNPISHPSFEGIWAPGLRLDLAVYLAELDSEGDVLEVTALEFREFGLSRDAADLGDAGPLTDAYYPRPEYWVLEIGSGTNVSTPHSFRAWIGMPHPRAGP